MSVEVIRDEGDQQQFDASFVDGLDPNLHYRWLRNDPMNLAKREIDGYLPIERTTEKSVLSDSTRLKKGEDITEKYIVRQDLVLGATPKENYEKRCRQELARVYRRTKGVADAYKSAVARIAQSNDNAYEEHRDNRTMRSSPNLEEMTPAQMQEAEKLLGHKS